MGKTTNHLLVTLLIACLLTVSLPCLATVQAEDYDAFWLWSGVTAQPVLNKAHTLYLLNGQIVADYQGKTHFIKQGNGLIKNQPAELWLVYRADTLTWSAEIYKQLLQQLTI